MNPDTQFTKILFGPYGTRLDEMSSQRGLPGLSDPVSILNGPDYRNALSELAENYLRVGALVAAAWFETVSTIEEAIGIARATAHHRTPCLISFVIDHDGNLLSGENPLDAIRAVDAATSHFPYGYGFNCCPIEGIPKALEKLGDLASRIKALYPNASSRPQRTALEGLSSSTGQVIGARDSDGVAKYLNHLARKYRIEIIGGCCGFGTEDVSKIVSATREGFSQETLPLTDFPRR